MRRAALVHRSLQALTAVSVFGTVCALALPLRLQAAPAALFVGLMAAAHLVERRLGHRAAAGFVAALGLPILGLLTLSDGGATGLLAQFLPVSAMIVWALLGRRWGIVAVAVSIGFTAAGAWATPAQPTDAQLAVAHVCAMVLAGAFAFTASTELRRAADVAQLRAEEAASAAADAVEADEARDRLLAAVSHDLRTPLDAVLGSAEMLREVEADPERVRDLDRIQLAGRHLLSLIDDMLQIRAGPDDALRVEPVRVDRLAAEVVATTLPLAGARGNRISVRVDAEIPAIDSDPRRLRQILLNLVSNANAYTSGGEIRLEVDRDGAAIRVAVRDTGIGIPQHKLDQLFRPFVQLHEGPDRRPGVGLGLALSQRLAHRLGGRIAATSTEGVGSTFTLHLPGPAGASAPG